MPTRAGWAAITMYFLFHMYVISLFHRYTRTNNNRFCFCQHAMSYQIFNYTNEAASTAPNNTAVVPLIADAPEASETTIATSMLKSTGSISEEVETPW